MKVCKECGGSEASGHQVGCGQEGKDDAFVISAIIGAVTNSAILGGLLGGDLVGGIVGDLFNGGSLDD